MDKPSLHNISRLKRTPLLDLLDNRYLFRHDAHHEYATGIPSELPPVLRFWLKYLQECDVDLEEYGRRETELYEQGLVRWKFEIGLLKSLMYGPSPSDWKVDMVFRHWKRSSFAEGHLDDDMHGIREVNLKDDKNAMPGAWIGGDQ